MAVNWSISPTGTGSCQFLRVVHRTYRHYETADGNGYGYQSGGFDQVGLRGVTVNVPAPVITSISPATAAPASQITITGQNFLTSPGTVTLNGVSLPTTSGATLQSPCW